MKLGFYVIASTLVIIGMTQYSYSIPIATPAREAAEYIVAKFPSLSGKQTIDQIAEKTTQASLKYGDGVLPMLKTSGPAGFKILEDAGEKAPDVIKLFARKGNQAIWIISEPKKLSIFLKHGDSAADALLKHPGIADDLLTRFGNDATGALNSVSKQGAQRLGIIDKEGLLSATPRSKELLPVIAKYGDPAMEFIWRNKGALMVTAALVTFLNNPQTYIQGATNLIVDPIAKPIVANTNWTLIFAGALLIIFLPFVARSLLRLRTVLKNNGVAKK